MTGSFLDVDAPNTAWRSGSEDPIPVLFGHLWWTAGAYRYVTARPMDGVARTNATFLRPGDKCFTKSGRTAPWNYWPGWKRGLLLTRYPTWVGAYAGAAILEDAWNLTDKYDYTSPWWMTWEMPAGLYAPIAAYGAVRGVQYARNYRHERRYLRPIRQAVIATLRTRDSVYIDIPRGMVKGHDETATGKVFLPTAHALPEGDRDNLLTVVRERLAHEELDARFNMEGTRPHMELFTPPKPPALVPWELAVSRANADRPYLGEAAARPVYWDLGDDSPHMGIVGGSGSGKSELIAWVVAQFMTAGAGVVVLDPKGTSHRWLLDMSRTGQGPLYCGTRAMLHDTIMWLDTELDRRTQVNLSMSTDQTFARLVVLLEERNSVQDMLRDHWADVRPQGAPMMSPAIRALNRLASMGRSLGITVLLAAQETAQVHIGQKSNYGAWSIAGRMGQNHWRTLMGAGSKKPAISSKPGRFGYVVAGQPTVFQAAYPNLGQHADRLVAFALSGDALLNVAALMQQQDTPPFPSSAAVTSEGPTLELVTLGEFADQTGADLTWLRSRKDRDIDFPPAVGKGDKNANLYRLIDLLTWKAEQ